MPVTRDEVIRVYQLFLGRYPESEDAIQNHLRCENIAALRRIFMRSPEFHSRLSEMGISAFPGAPPDPAGIGVDSVLSRPANSGELLQKAMAKCAPDLVKAAYIGLLGREPDAEGLTSYALLISQTMDLSAFFADLIHSDEFMQKVTPLLSRELVRQIYVGLLKREPAEEGLAAYSAALRTPNDMGRIMENVLRSSEFAACYADAHAHLDPDEALSCIYSYSKGSRNVYTTSPSRLFFRE